jgi:signal transduction histidine kinase
VLSADWRDGRLAYADVVIRDAARAFWAEPRAPNPPARVWWDWAFVAVLVPAAVVEGILREDLAWPAPSVAVGVVVALTLLWRRTQPLVAVAVAFGSITVVDVASFAAGVDWLGLNTMVGALVLPYALFRWGAGREAALGVPIIMIPVATLPGFDEVNSTGDVVAGIVIVLFAMALGATVRYRGSDRLRRLDQAKLREREQLARELHDTVAHHVSAIAIQAQAGRTVAQSQPEAVLDALVVVEKEASRALTEMRTIVGALRQGEQSDLAPQPGVADIERLAKSSGDAPHVDVTLTGDLDQLHSSVDAALYRLAQESVTNALRHARHATLVHVVVTGDDDSVRLTVWDNGDARPAGTGSSSGFGLLGMAERARLLGGTLEAGPNRHQGWTVHAVLPKSGAAV